MISKSDSLLILVESKYKANTVLKIFKDLNFDNINILATSGHIIYLDDGGIFNSGVFPEKNFGLNFKIRPDKAQLIKEIITKAKEADKILFLTNNSREGDFISWSLINFCEIDRSKAYRIYVSELTITAIANGLQNLSQINMNLVDSVTAKIVSDKLLGYALSPIGKKFLGTKSIGRYQALGLLLLTEQENTINTFVPELFYDVKLKFFKDDMEYIAKYDTRDIRSLNKADAASIVSTCKNKIFKVSNITKTSFKKAKIEPLCTKTFLYKALQELNISSAAALQYAQKLFYGLKIENSYKSLITSVYTDSTTFSNNFVEQTSAYIKNTYGNNALKEFKTCEVDQDILNSESLRVVDINFAPEKLSLYTSDEKLLQIYALIWKYSLLPLLKDTKCTNFSYNLRADDFTFCYSFIHEPPDIGDDSQQTAILKLDTDEALENSQVYFEKTFTQVPQRYTELTITNKLNELKLNKYDITTAVLKTILDTNRNYAELDLNNFIVPTRKGLQLISYYKKVFPSIINIKYLKSIDDSIELIAAGKLSLINFMTNLLSDLQTALDKAKPFELDINSTEKVCPACGSRMVIRRSRFGRLFYGCSNYPDCSCTLSLN